MVRWVVGSILHGVDPLSYFSFQPVLHDCQWDGAYIIRSSSPCGGSGFPLSLSEWSLTQVYPVRKLPDTFQLYKVHF